MSGAPQTRTTKGSAEEEAEAAAEGSCEESEAAFPPLPLEASSVAAKEAPLFSSRDSDERGFSKGGAAREAGAAAAAAAAAALSLFLPAPLGLTPAAIGATACSFLLRASHVLSSCSLEASDRSDGEEHVVGPGAPAEPEEAATGEEEEEEEEEGSEAAGM